MITRLNQGSKDFADRFNALLNARREGVDHQVASTTSEIIDDVQKRGGIAVAEITARYDKLEIDPQTLQAPGINIEAIADTCPADVRAAIDLAASRIETFHREHIPQPKTVDDQAGIKIDYRWTPIEAVGLYVPGGRASYPSSVLMNAIPAQVAGVKRMVITSPMPNGECNSAVAYAAICAGVKEFYPVGGAQAVAALTYGAGELKPVQKIVGPGNAYVSAAKKQVFGRVGIDTVAGPSEITIVADETADAPSVAADMLAQAEHDPMAQSILITDSSNFADEVTSQLDTLLETLATKEVARASLQDFGAIIIAPREHHASLVDQIAPEHLAISQAASEKLANDVKNAGAIFVGHWSCEALGDYATGSNHVLPTSGAARFASGLSTIDFMKRTSIQTVSQEGFNALADAVETLAKFEGLPAHALSVSIRKDKS